jgi:hypothetical protein
MSRLGCKLFYEIHPCWSREKLSAIQKLQQSSVVARIKWGISPNCDKLCTSQLPKKVNMVNCDFIILKDIFQYNGFENGQITVLFK